MLKLPAFLNPAVFRVFAVCCVSGLLWSSVAVAAEPGAAEFLASRSPAPDATVHPPVRWSATDNVAWKTDIPGLGWSSPIVWGDKIFVTTCVNTGKNAEPKKGLYLDALDANKYPKETNDHLYKLYCLSLSTGEVLWDRVAHQGIPAKPHHIKNTLASETPTTDGEKVFALFGNLGMFCYDMDGNLLWKYDIQPRETTMGWGTSMSPILYQDRVYIVNDNEEDSWLIALDKQTGEEVWKVPRETQSNWSTPYIWENEFRTEIIINGKLFTRAYDLDGNELWRIAGRSAVAVPRPFEKYGLLFVSSGHVVFGDNRTYAIRPGATGDISPVDPNEASDYLEWWTESGTYHPTPIIVNDRLFMLLDRGFMLCYDAKTGEPIYGKQRISGGRAFTSSPWTYDDKLFCLNEDGVTFVIGTEADYELLYKNELAADDMGMSSPVIVGDKLLIRTSARLYCIAE